jgi:Domain of unknown function (DUF1842)
MPNGPVGLFLLRLHTKTIQPGGVTLTLTLTVSTPTDQVTGHASVTQAVNPPLDVQSHVSGTLIHQFVMPPGQSHQRIDLTGYPIIHWPPGGGIGPVILPNFKAIIVLDASYSEGVANFQWRTFAGTWHSLTQDVVKF